MAISPTSISQNSTAASTAASATPSADSDQAASEQSTTLEREEFNTFLTLLTAQIKNQDPLAPLDSTQFVEQLATFTSLELQAKNNATLDTIANLLTAQFEGEGEVETEQSQTA